jgi:hypothetical protein
VDDELLSIAKASIASEFGLSAEQSRRLHGETASEIKADAKAMAKELGIAVDDRQRDDAGRFAGGENAKINTALRRAAGRTS